MRTFYLSGIPIALLGRAELRGVIEDFLQDGQVHQIVTVNPEFIVAANRDARYQALLASADLATADGTGLILAARLQGVAARFSDRLPGVELTQELLALAERTNYPVAILLKSNSITSPQQLAEKIRELYPRLRTSIFQEPISVESIAKAKPRILFVSFGSPAQDFWIEEQRARIPGLSIALGVGGTFDFISGTIQRAPQYIRNIGLEWLWRLSLEPKRLPRIVRALIIFPYLVVTKNYDEKNID